MSDTKKDLEYYLSLQYIAKVVYDEEDDSYVVYYPDLPGCITTGKTKEEALVNAEDAKISWFTAALEDCPDLLKEPIY